MRHYNDNTLTKIEAKQADRNLYIISIVTIVTALMSAL